MKILSLLLLLLLVVITACSPGQTIVVPTGIPPELATGIAKAPTEAAVAAATAQAAFNAAGTEAARAGSTTIPSAATAAAQAATAAAQAAATAIPPAQTAAAAARTAAAGTPVPAPGPGTPSAESTIDIKLSEYKVEMPVLLRAGTKTFRVTNTGTTAHSLEVTAPGVDQKLDTPLAPGETRTMQVTLVAGAYQVFCPLDGHRDQGMSVNVIVTP